MQQGALINGIVTTALVLLILWLALRSFKIVLAVSLTLGAGLAITAAVGLLVVGAFNPISLAFAVLCVGLEPILRSSSASVTALSGKRAEICGKPWR